MTTAPVPLNSLSRHIGPVQSELIRAASTVIESGFYVLGPNVAAFEREFAAYCGAPHCVGVANGTDALELALKAVGVEPGDRVAVTANAAMYGASATYAAGAKVVFVDIEPGCGTMDPECFAALLRDGQPLKSVIVTHLYGRMAKIDEIVSMAHAAGVMVVEDCAQAHGARLSDGRRAGSIGDAGSFSFYPTKNLGALGDGGAIVTRHEHVATRAAQLRQYGWTSKYTNEIPGGRNSRLDEIQAAMLSVMLPMLDGWNARRRGIANRYSREIRNPRIEVPVVLGDQYVAHLYVVRCDSREELRAHLDTNGVQSEVHYPNPDHRQPCHQGSFDSLTLAVTESDAATVLSLPCFPELTDAEVGRVVDACNSF
ncbi:DegT/DnrJ/EryC1/StrS family aminotransferase [Lysobacter sp. A286]